VVAPDVRAPGDGSSARHDNFNLDSANTSLTGACTIHR